MPRGPFVWVKDAPKELPPSFRRCPQPAKSRQGGLVDYPLVNDLPSLLWMLELGAVDLHVWPSRCDRPDRPDYVLFDLDGPTPATVDAAHRLRAALETLDLESYPRTTGGSGLHVVVPIARRYTHEDARRFARILAAALDLEPPAKVDTKMIGHGQQVVSVYSVRPLPHAPVATPLRWEEVTPDLDPAAYNLATVPNRIATLGDLHEPLLHGRQRLALLANTPRRT